MSESVEAAWNTSGLILEGICGSGKTVVLRALLRSKRFVERPYLSTIILSEHQTQRVLERKEREEGLTPQDNLSLLDGHVSYLESIHDRLGRMVWCRRGQTGMRLPWILERFHLTHVCHYAHMRWEQVEGIDRRLAGIGGKICLFAISEAEIERRVIRDRDATWKNYIRRFGETDREIVKHYAEQQEAMLELCEKSAMEAIVVDTSSGEVGKTVDRVLDFWGAVDP